MVAKRLSPLFSYKDKLFALGSPAIAWQVLFFYLPLAILCISSFFVKDVDTDTFSTLSLSHFKTLVSSSHLLALLNSCSLALFTAFACLLIALPIAIFLAFYSKRYKYLLLALLIIPFWTNFLLHVYAWFFVLEREGVLNNALMTLHLIDTPVHFLNSTFATSLMMVYYYLPFMVLPLYSALDRFDLKLFEASETLGASKWRTFFNILLPLIRPAVLAGFFLVFIPAFGEFIIPELMGGGKTFFVGSVVSNYIMGTTTTHLGAGFFLISFVALALLSLLLYRSIGLLCCKGMSRGLN